MTYKIDKRRIEYQYAKKIISGEYLADEPEILACKRFMRDLERQNENDPTFPYCYDTTRADRIMQFFSKCANIEASEGAYLEPFDFQYFDLCNIFGWVHKKTGVRRFTEALIFQARGQGKSTESAAVSLYGLTADKIYPPYQPENGHFELNPSIITLAVDKAQTKQVRGAAMEMARRSETLQDETVCKNTYIKGKRRGGEIIAVSKETGNLDGEKANYVICDEWAAHKEETRVNVLKGSFGKREQCLLLKITTAGEDAMHKPAKTDYDRCLEVLHGRVKDETYFIMIRQLGEKDDPADFTLYEKAAPVLRKNCEYSRRLMKAIQDEYNKAFNGGSEQQKIEFLIKRTNRWQVGSENKFFNQDALDMLEKSLVPKEEFLSLIQGKMTTVGIDASKVIDLTAETFLFNLGEGKFGIYPHGFMPLDSLERHKKTDKLPYEAYHRKGDLTLIDGSYIDNVELKQYLCDFEKDNKLQVKAVCADRAYCYQLLIDLESGRMPNNKAYTVIEIPQTTTHLNEPCIDFMKLLMAGKLVICENDLFLQHCANAYVEYDRGGRMKVCKKNANSSFRIDLLAATLFAFRRKDLLEGENLKSAIQKNKFSF